MRHIAAALVVVLVASTAVAQIDEAKDYLKRANESSKKGNYDRAIGGYTEVIRLVPKNAIPYNSRGVAWESKGDFAKAIADFDQAVKLNPKYDLAYYNRGRVWKIKGDHTKAIADFGEAIRLDPTYVNAYYNRGNTYASIGDYTKAISDYNETIRLDPNYVIAYYNRAHSWRLKGEYGKATSDYKETIRLDPKYAGGYWSLARIKATCPNTKYRSGDEAVAYARRAMKLMESMGRAHDGVFDALAAAYAECGDFKQAIEWQERAIALTPDAHKADYRSRLELYKQGKPYRELVKK